jgi:hypothetical protein
MLDSGRSNKKKPKTRMGLNGGQIDGALAQECYQIMNLMNLNQVLSYHVLYFDL